MTIIGFEKLTDGTKNLLVFDPMFHDSSKVVKLVGGPVRTKHPGDLLKAYRRGNKYLKRYNEFELLKYVALFSSSQCKPDTNIVVDSLHNRAAS